MITLPSSSLTGKFSLVCLKRLDSTIRICLIAMPSGLVTIHLIPMLFLSGKKDGPLKFFIDLRMLNSRREVAYMLPRFDDSVDLLVGSRFFSKLDFYFLYITQWLLASCDGRSSKVIQSFFCG
jgi:hypothetical protein